jgi:hypothetical protein
MRAEKREKDRERDEEKHEKAKWKQGETGFVELHFTYRRFVEFQRIEHNNGPDPTMKRNEKTIRRKSKKGKHRPRAIRD